LFQAPQASDALRESRCLLLYADFMPTAPLADHISPKALRGRVFEWQIFETAIASKTWNGGVRVDWPTQTVGSSSSAPLVPLGALESRATMVSFKFDLSSAVSKVTEVDYSTEGFAVVAPS
jgi:hypothetical protein